MVGPQRAVVASQYKLVVVVCGSQMGKTDTILSIIGQRVDEDPTPTLLVFPTRESAETELEPRLTAMLQGTPRLWERTRQGKKNRKTLKVVNGVRLRFAWAGSATQLAAMSAGLAILDERDRMPVVVGEGDPVGLVRARGSNYPQFTMVVTSTPLLGTVSASRHEQTGLEHWDVADPEDVQSPTWKLWQGGTRCEWAWPCPECGLYFIPRFKHLVWPKGSTPAQAERAARLKCINCAAEIDDSCKSDLNAAGRHVSPGQSIHPDGTVEGAPVESTTASFWVSGLCSPWVPFGVRAAAFLDAHRSGEPGAVQVEINTGFGELYSIRGEAPTSEAVAARRLPYRFGEIPEGVLGITAGGDVQGDRFYWTVRGWGAGLESWQLDHGVHYGDMQVPGVLRGIVTSIVTQRFGDLGITLFAIDSGFAPAVVYDLARDPALSRQVYATKGRQELNKPFYASKVDVSLGGRTYKQGVSLWHLDTSRFKTFIHERIAWKVDQPGGWHLSADTSDEFCEHIVAEAKVKNRRGGYFWVQLGKKANHWLDCEMNATAAAWIAQYDKRFLSARRVVTVRQEPPPTSGMPAMESPPAIMPVYVPPRRGIRARFRST